MQTQKSAPEIQAYVDVKSGFTDYPYFQDSTARRAESQRAFIHGSAYEPDYLYPKLDRLYDTVEGKTTFAERKRDTYEAILELEANKGSGVISDEEYEFYAGGHEMRLKKMMLVEAAKRLREAGNSQAVQTARQEFMQLNHEIYGEIDEAVFGAMMATESRRVANFIPADERTRNIQQQLLRYFDMHEFQGEEAELLTNSELIAIQKELHRRFGKELEEFPDTPDDVYYDATQCADIMNRAINADGFDGGKWKFEVSHEISIVSTHVAKKRIYLPATTRRNAAELRRLYLHERGVHADRSVKGEATGVRLLKYGTAKSADVEEGDGVLYECAEAGTMENPSINRARDRYIVAGLALGADGQPKDGRQTYEMMWRLLAVKYAEDGFITEAVEARAKKEATVHDDNAFRGTNWAMPGVIYSKLKVYYEGIMKDAAYYRQAIADDRLSEAMDDSHIGNIDHTNPQELYFAKRIIAKQQAVAA